MVAALRKTVTVQPGGLIEVRSNELPAGASAEVIVLLSESPAGPHANPSVQDPLQALDELQRSARLTPEAAADWVAELRKEREVSSDPTTNRLP